MRLAAQVKGGYYPAPPKAVADAMQHVSPPPDDGFSILDPCCGQGLALSQIAKILNCEPKNVYGCELSPDLGEDAADILPGSKIVSPVDFLSISCSNSSFGFAWVNPPFDTMVGGGRAELAFLKKVTDKLCVGGVLAFVVPQHVAEDYDIQAFLLSYYGRLFVKPFPKECRRFKEVVVFGVRLKDLRSHYSVKWERECSLSPRSYDIPKSSRPITFRKAAATDDEILAALAKSPASSVFRTREDPPLARPPLPLGAGHIALLVSAGHLDGLIAPDGEPPHVVRGLSKKVEYVDNVSEEETGDGALKTVTIVKQRIVIVVRAVDETGTIATFTDQKDHEKDVGEVIAGLDFGSDDEPDTSTNGVGDDDEE